MDGKCKRRFFLGIHGNWNSQDAKLCFSRSLRSLLPVAYCANVDYTGAVSSVSRAETYKLRDVFNRYASFTDKRGVKHMTPEDFVRK